MKTKMKDKMDMAKFTTFIIIALFLGFPNVTLADDANDIKRIRKSLILTAKTEKNLGHSNKANKLLLIEGNIAKNISSSRIAYVIKTALNEGKFNEALLLSLGYEMPRRDDKESYREYNAIVENCEKKWDQNLKMINYCVEKQIKARSEVLSFKNNRIRKDCEKKWGDDFSMVSYCIKKKYGK